MSADPPDDLAAHVLASLLGPRPVRSFPALLATQAEAMAWARAGGPHGALVVADYEAAPRGRGGLPWDSRPGRDLGFSVVLRPGLPTAREGWLYLPAVAALADVLAPDVVAPVHWPDEVHGSEGRRAAIGVHTEPDERELAWAVLTVRVDAATPPRGPLLARLLTALDARLAQEADAVLAEVEAGCATLGERVCARLVPLGPAGVEVTGTAVGCRRDGSLAIETGPGRTVAVPPHTLGVLEPAGRPSGDALPSPHRPC